jgi:hypothetical protein
VSAPSHSNNALCCFFFTAGHWFNCKQVLRLVWLWLLYTCVTPATATVVCNSCYECPTATDVTVTIPNIPDYAFTGCGSFTSVTIASTVTSIGYEAFTGTQLTSLIIPNSVNSLDYTAVTRISTLTTLVIGDGVTGDLPDWVLADCEALQSVTIGAGITSIAFGAFDGCTALSTVVIGNSVTDIYWNAFAGCTALTRVVIGDSVTHIFDDAFSGCTALTQVILSGSVTTIGSSAFSGCTALTEVVIGDSVSSIGESAFQGCTALTQVVLNGSVTTIGSSAFSGCTALTEVVIGDNVSSIGANPPFKAVLRLLKWF